MNHTALLAVALLLTACDSASTTATSAVEASSSAAGSAVTAEPTSSSVTPQSETSAADAEETGTSAGFDTSEALAKAIVETYNAPTRDKIRALFPTKELLDKLVTCKQENSLAKGVQSELSQMVKNLGEPVKQAPITFVSSESNAEKSLVKGQTHRDCAINEDVASHKLKITVSDKDGDNDDENFGVMVHAGKWYLVDP